MGSPESENGRKEDEVQHQVTINKDYWLGKYPVTQKQYQNVTGKNPSYFDGGNNPVECVTWNNAGNFCKKVGGRLPTEAEWEFAARGGNNSKGYIYSGSNTIENVAWYSGSNSPDGTKSVGQKQPNELGLYDMSGNVWEWCSDWYGDYPSGPVNDTKGTNSGSYRVIRGGFWGNNAEYCRIAYRYDITPSGDYCFVGFRVVFDAN
jgi:formylglycine-generating enzyme required for sulfatase activity